MPKYDAVILGAGLSGCAIAAIMANAGKRVIIMDPAAAPGGNAASVDLQGYRISGWPTCAYGFEEGGAWSSLLLGLGLPRADSMQSAPYQVALPGRRITVSPDADTTLAELGREYPSEIDAVRRFYRDAVALGNRLSRNRMSAYLARRRKARGLIRSYGFSRELIAFFSAASWAFFGTPVEEISVAQLVGLVTQPPRLVSGGFDQLAGELCEFVRRRGGECRFNEPWPEMLIRRSRLEGVKTAGERIDIHTAVLNVPWTVRQRTLFSLVREEVVPVGMLDTVLVVNDYDHPEVSMVVSLDTPIARGASGQSVRQLRALFSGKERQHESAEDLLGTVSQIVPFLTDFTEATEFRDSRERNLLVQNEAGRQLPMPSEGVFPFLRLPIRTIYVLEDAPFGMTRQADAVIALASRLS